MFFKGIQIGSIKIESNILIAPLAGYTNLPTRQILRKLGANLCYAEMVSAEGLNYSFDKSVLLIETKEDDRPLGIQLFGPDEDRIAFAFEKIKNYNFDIVDINCGCSVNKIIKSRSGATLLKSPETIYKIISRLKTLTDKPVTLKIRSGWDNSSINYLEVLDAAEKGGASLITLHPRTKSMLFNGKANWEHIRILKEKSNIPVIGNGDIFTADDAIRMFETTKCDGIMLARGIIENPFLIEEVMARVKNIQYTLPDIERRIKTLLKHCKLMVDYYGETKGIKEFRKYVRGYIKGYPNSSKLRDEINKIDSYSKLESAVYNYYEYYNKSNS
ncbi:MAG TPA: tRNA dihydrouridine synthase DusB [Spirochaetota bacterium]|nr:tRNA dihydrouridine synthase DusB [Spirochaetota bacterium]HOL56694.1 tRNA dihydrouridine synthase DusB [Spirochaetota bacterium]HPP05566.1 tRNA dihydrouridine synthase DusB [Spirochaetota bacterium]